MKVTVSFVRELVEKRLRIKKYSPMSIVSYIDTLLFFEKYMIKIGITDFRDVNNLVAEGFVDFLISYTFGKKQKRLALNTLVKRSVNIKKIFKMLTFEDIIFIDPFRNIQKIRENRTLPKDIMSTHEIDRLFSQPDTNTYLGFRDRTIFEILYGTGVRIGELTSLEVYDIDFDRGLVFVSQGKGRKDRQVPCTTPALLFLREYFEKVRPALSFFNSREKALFLSKSGIPFQKNCFKMMLQKYLKKSGITKKITAHSFRHTFATHMLEGGVNVRYLQEILGHENLSTTAIYTRVAITNLHKMIRQYHPRENELFEKPEIKLPREEFLMRRIRQKKEEKTVE